MVARLEEQIRAVHVEIAGMRSEQAASNAAMRELLQFANRESATGIGFVQQRVGEADTRIDRVEERLAVVERWQAARSSIPQTQENHEKRLAALEQFRWKVMGGAAVVAAVGGGVGAAVARVVGS